MRAPRRANKLLIGVLGICLLFPGGLHAAEPFTEEALIRGIDYLPGQIHTPGQGLAFADLDDDGDPDVVVLGRTDGVIGIYENDGTGHFIDRSDLSASALALKSSGVSAADYDRDGDLDLHIACWSESDMLLRNDGDFQFTDVGHDASVADPGLATGCGWGDYDNDGWPDLIVATEEQPYRLYHNLGDGTFEDVLPILGTSFVGEGSYQASFFDFGRDGDADLYITTIRGVCETPDFSTSHLFENFKGTFLEITEEAGAEACADAMSIALGDFDNNREMDIYITNEPPGNVLLMNQANGTFEDEAVEAGVPVHILGWGAVFFDYDNDGILDLYVCNQMAPNNLYRHEGAWPCADVAEDMGVDTDGMSFTVAAADIDNDGDLDLLLQNRFEPIRLFINHEGEVNRWAKFDVVGEGPSRYAIGANIDVRTGADWQIREVIAGCNYKAQNELLQHFGLGTAAAIDEVVVLWPGGATRTLYNLTANQTWTLYPTDKLGDADHDGDRDIDDFAIFAGCYNAPFAPGCEMMDFDGSGGVDMGDFEAFLGLFDGTPPDCDDDGTIDMEEILLDPSLDTDGDGELDECDCLGDLDGSGTVGAFDLAVLLGAWGVCEGCSADLNGDGVVGAFDLALLLGAWGECP